MRAQITQREFDLFRTYIEKNCGISLKDNKKYLVESRLADLLTESGASSFSDFYRQLERAPSLRSKTQIIDAMTTNETLWFRDGSPWVAMRDHILPRIERRKGPGAEVRIWSAACSTGQEPYSMAMLVDSYASMPGRALRPSNVEIIATDISPSALSTARAGRYDELSMRRGFSGEWAPFRDRYFKTHEDICTIDPRMRERVSFLSFNLQDRLTRFGKFDLIFLRNVAIYFSAEFKGDVFDRMADSLNPGGLLVLGAAETTHGYSDRYETVTLGRAIAYRVKSERGESR